MSHFEARGYAKPLQADYFKYMLSDFFMTSRTDLHFNESFASFWFITVEQNETLKFFLDQPELSL